MAMCDYEPASGFNLPPGCFEEDVDREFGGERRYCCECAHAVESDMICGSVCCLKLKRALTGLKGTQRWTPKCILAVVEDAVVNEGDYCTEFEE